MTVHELRVVNREGDDPLGSDILHTIHRLKLGTFTNLKTVKVYRLEGVDEAGVKRLADAIIDVDQRYTLNKPMLLGATAHVEVGYKPGVMNPEVASLQKVAEDLGVSLVASDSSVEYHFTGGNWEGEIATVLNRLLLNATVQHVITEKPETLVLSGQRGHIKVVPVRTLDDDGLMALSQERSMFCNLAEMRVIRGEFVKLERDPYDTELETIAQTWSEHCKHKTFRALIRVNGKLKKPLMSRLMEASALYFEGVISAFEDNSGVVVFYDGYGICIKVETHNSPSAVEPYGGAATGSGGVFRDIIGTGQGAIVLAATDIFCLADPKLPISRVPAKCLHPEYLLRRIVAGVRDYGNRMGIPTCNGSVYFHEDFRAKPSVIVGACGLIPVERAKKGAPQAGDLIVLLGGRTGRDGIHGATFSSGEMTEKTSTVHASAVQIGNAIEEKRFADVVPLLRDRGFIRAITDLGAGGLASAVGEMGSEIGAHLRLEDVPLKYPGLQPWEITLSESQERMVIAIDPKDKDEVLAHCRAYNVEATVVGHFTGDNRFLVTYYGDTAAALGMSFLHDGLPRRVMDAKWVPKEYPNPTLSPNPSPEEFGELYRRVMGDLNVCSKEPIVRQYDHSVQGTSALTPYTGVQHDGPNDAAVLRPLLDKPYGIVLSHGLNPILNRIDPYWGSIWAVTEAFANYVAVGGDPKEVNLVDNFIWPFPDEESLGALDLSVDACVAMVHVLKRPFVSGKDSLSSTYRSGEIIIKVPPVLCIHAVGRIPDVTKTVSSDFKRSDSQIFLVGNPDQGALGGSVLYGLLGYVGNRIPRPNLAALPIVAAKLHEWIKAGKILACHDVSQGGIGTTLAEMCIGGEVGALVNLDSLGEGDSREGFFNETAGCFLIEVANENIGIVEELPRLIRWIGGTQKERVIKGISNESVPYFEVPIEELRKASETPMEEVFGHAS